MSMRASINFFLRKVLYLWVKTEVIPGDIQSLAIEPDTPVIYVLETRAWSNLLVLEETCDKLNLPPPLARLGEGTEAPEALQAWHSIYTVAPRQPFKAWLQKQPKRSRMLRGIVDILREYPEQEIQFVPVSVFWGRPIATQKHWLSVLFADSWALAGRTRTLFRILFHGRNTFIKYSEVITFRASTVSRKNDDAIIDTLQHTLSDRLRKIRTATLGPDISHRRTLVRELLEKPAVKKAIQKRSIEDNKSEYEATLQARRYLNEIVANCSNITIQLMQRALTAFWNRFYSGIDVKHHEYLKQLSLSHELVYVPCHRSHIDYLLLSYVIYAKGLAIPYIAAGKNLNMPVIGSILRGGGAFFIRRSFKGNELYSTVMFEYVANLVAKGVSIEYFVEGGRSRTGRLLQPKPGMLAMTVRGFLKYRKRPVAFIPVYIGYEKLLESKAYQAELSGEDKKSETFINSVKSILKIRGEYGKVSANFGKPVFLNPLLDACHPVWLSEPFEDEQRPPWIRDVVNSLSTDIMTRINQAATVNSSNLLASVLLATPNQSMDAGELATYLDQYKILINKLNYSESLIMTQRNGEEQIAHAELLKLVKRKRHTLGDMIYLDAKQARSMTYYRNNILHLMALPATIACCFFNVQTLKKADIIALVELAYPFIKKEVFLIWDKSEIPAVVSHILELMEEQNLLVKNEKTDSYSKSSTRDIEFSPLNLLAKVISPIYEVYYLTLALLSRKSAMNVSKPQLEEQCVLMAQRVAMMYELNAPDYSDKKLITNFLNMLIQIDYVKEYDVEQLQYTEVFQRTDKRIRLLLPKARRMNIMKMLRLSEANKQA